MENIPLSNKGEGEENISSNKKLYVKKVIIFSFSVVFLAVFFYFFLVSAPSDFPSQSIINIPKGENLTSISEKLKDSHIIRSKVLFEMFVVVYGGENHITEGDYLFENKLPVFEIARRVARRDRHLAPVRVTIPEGYDNAEIANTFSQYLRNFNKAKFISEAKNLQGYLFPDTYFFFTTDNEGNVLKYLSDNFSKKIKIVSKDIALSGKSEKDIIIMASIIEREAKGDSDRGIISGILWNRISKKMPLQVDAVPDTYKKIGLPSSPICNPGQEAIIAAIYPVRSHYLYYLHDKNGMIHYAVSFNEHKENKLKYLK